MVKIFFKKTDKATNRVVEGQSSKAYKNVKDAVEDMAEFEFETEEFKQEVTEIKEETELHCFRISEACSHFTEVYAITPAEAYQKYRNLHPIRYEQMQCHYRPTIRKVI